MGHQHDIGIVAGGQRETSALGPIGIEYAISVQGRAHLIKNGDNGRYQRPRFFGRHPTAGGANKQLVLKHQAQVAQRIAYRRLYAVEPFTGQGDIPRFIQGLKHHLQVKIDGGQIHNINDRNSVYPFQELPALWLSSRHNAK